MTDISRLNEIFIHHYNKYASQNSLMTILAGDLRKISFILDIARHAFATIDKSDSRFEPNPLFYFPIIYPREPVVTKEEISNFFLSVKDTNEFFNFLRTGIKSNTTTDHELVNFLIQNTALGIKFVKLLYFFVFSNTIAFSSVVIPGITDKYYVFKISHNVSKEDEFYQIRSENKILFHGTSLTNLYSIMRNGVRTMSGGKYQKNGAVYGNGIYLTDKFDIASGYGVDLNFSKNLITIGGNDETIEVDNEKSESMCILLFDSKNLNKQGRGYCFVQQENEVILRCIFLVNKKYGISNDTNLANGLISFAQSQSIKYRPIETYLMNSLTISDPEILTIPEVRNEPKNGDRIVTSIRFNKEIDKLMDTPKNEGENTIIKINFLNPNDKHSPLLILLSPDKDTDLYKDLRKYNIPGILVAIYFPSGADRSQDYPNNPPKIRVVSPMLVDGTGRVTKGGSLCADLLYPEGWSPANRIESILRNLIIAVATEGSRNGPGRVDPNRLGKVYSYDSYVKSFGEAAGFHGYTAI